MTLIVAIPARDGVIFASDSQVTWGAVRSTGTKIFKLNSNALWGGSGELAVIQRVAERIEALPQRGQPLATIRDALAAMVNEEVSALLRIDFRAPFAKGPQDLLGLHPADFLFAEHRDRCMVLHILANGTPEWVERRCAATGTGDVFAYTLLAKYETLLPLARDKAKLLAYKVIEEAIQVGAYGLGPPIDLWEVSATGTAQATPEEIRALEDAAEILRGEEVRMFADQPPSAEGPFEPAPATPEAPSEQVTPGPSGLRPGQGSGRH